MFAIADFTIKTEDKVLTCPTRIYKWEYGQMFGIGKIAIEVSNLIATKLK